MRPTLGTRPDGDDAERCSTDRLPPSIGDDISPVRRRPAAQLTSRAAFLLGHIQPYVEQYGSWAVALAILLEDFGLPAPGETALVLGAIYASTNTISIYALLPLAWAGAVTGDNIGYAIGHFGGHHLMVRYGSRIGVTEARLKHVELFFDRHGGWVIVFARFVVILRQFNGIVAGTLGMHWLHFLALNALGAALWVGFWGMLAFWLGKGVMRYVDELHQYAPELATVAAILLIGGAYYLWRRFRKRDG
jgi:membrane protein DedA with SNARE-associated domain